MTARELASGAEGADRTGRRAAVGAAWNVLLAALATLVFMAFGRRLYIRTA